MDRTAARQRGNKGRGERGRTARKLGRGGRAKVSGSGSFPGTAGIMTSASSAPRPSENKASLSINTFALYLCWTFHQSLDRPRTANTPRCSCQSPRSSPDFQSPPPLPRAVWPIRWSTVGVKHWQGKHTPSDEVDSRHPTMCLRLRTQRHCLLQSFNVAHAGSTFNPTRGSKQVAFNTFLAFLAQCVARFRRIGESLEATE
ncbi:hypothetical protein ASPVEDRAFT_836071 [Aspergillus versicolor CBS 583.65]|uniref:Uncharacterized protein n=1 Tax=Aspergillus versicolor CBS 583.65 TaxID=1036611 RepID=A0A1L9PUH1_ASPVE|nr:uncharacterized protein ASPVEDRAFT_836071 [Aspergillus versicolor CBS 583.65]OJJ05210.1 hypothetical protein ASPVEDRAFT_836071 [Aspergillus versicolor CBS 583.65]